LKDAHTYFSQKLVDLSSATLRKYGAVAKNFSDYEEPGSTFKRVPVAQVGTLILALMDHVPPGRALRRGEKVPSA